MREQINAYAVKYSGNYSLITKALRTNEAFSPTSVPCDYVVIGERDYPKQLYQLEQPPFILYYEGNIDLLQTDMISIVGSRKHTQLSEHLTSMATRMLSEKYTIVSGMAKGIDAIAHNHAKNTIGVLGNGINVIYPKNNIKLYEHMRNKQLLISEYPPNVSPQKHHFPFRNRIIVALGSSLIVPCANERGGSMVSVNEALKLDKEIYTFPYSILDTLSCGCNDLIEQGANMITRLEDISKI